MKQRRVCGLVFRSEEQGEKRGGLPAASLGGVVGRSPRGQAAAESGGWHTLKEKKQAETFQLRSLTRKELSGLSRALHGWRLGIGNRIYPLSCWEQLSFSDGLLSPGKQAHNSH